MPLSFSSLLSVTFAPTLAVLKLDYGMVVMLAGVTASMAVQLLLTWSKEEILRQHTGKRVLQYPLGMRILVKGLWVIGIGLLVLAGFAIGGPHAKFAMAFAIAVNVFVLVLHLLVFGERVTWDEHHIHVFPLWGRTRVVPMNSVVSCAFSKAWQQYHVRTDGNEVVKVNIHWVGVPDFLGMLPCKTPEYPPAT